MIRVGRYEITAIEEVSGYVDSSFFPAANPIVLHEVGSQLDRTFYDPESRQFPISVHSWLVRSPDAAFLIDACFGNNKDRSPEPGHMLQTPWLHRLKAAGVSTADIDYVLLTHLHSDHIGWNTHLVVDEWRPTFPNALYVMTQAERELRDPRGGLSGGLQENTRPFHDSVKPVLDRARYRLVKGDESDLVDGVDFLPTPGHAPGQMAIRIRDEGKEALFIADVAHLPIQVHIPTLNSKWCEDRPAAARTRDKVLDYAADAGCLVLPTHFPGTHCGYVRRSSSSFLYVPLDQPN